MKLSNFAKFTWGVLAWSLLDILWGAYVRASGSGSGCGNHWPSCDGQVVPRSLNTEMRIEFTHRLLSAGVLLLILIMVIWGWRTYQKGHPVRKGLVASGSFVILEALLGAGLVLFGLTAENQSVARAAAVALHLANTFLLIGSLSLTAFWASGGNPVRIKDHKGRAWLLGLGLLGVLIIGMSGAVTALGDTLFPVTSLAEGLQQDVAADAHFLIRLRVYHPIIAITVAIYSLYLVRYFLADANPLSRRLLFVLAGVIGLQLALGLTNLLLLAPIPMQIIHLFMADLVWITYVVTSASLLAPINQKS